MKKIHIFDTTLRDGEQTPGVSLNTEEKLQIAHELARLNVDVIEAGFPIASPGDFEAVRAIAEEIKGPIIAALCRATTKDIDRAWEALQFAEKPRIHTFIATSPVHRQYKLKKTPTEIITSAVNAVNYAKNYTPDVEFSAEDASRTEPEFLYQVIEAVINAGATVINIPDTVGYSIPDEFGALIKGIKENVPNIKQAIISVHCHNDLGMAMANSVAAIENGAQQIECTINGLGERAGNAALEEVAMTIKTREDFLKAECQIITEHISRASHMISKLTGVPIQPNKAVVGTNAFAHESGIHQDGILKERTTYEIMCPQSIGLQENMIVLGKHSGRHAFRQRLSDLGYQVNDADITSLFEQFKMVADKKKEITDRDIEALIRNKRIEIPQIFHLKEFHISSGTQKDATATLTLQINDQTIKEAACGDGPVDAIYKTIERITGIRANLEEYAIRAITGGKDALGEVTVRVTINNKTYIGHGISTDILEASANAYIHAFNKIAQAKKEAL